ncbi:MAG: hypothetical protein P1V81_05360 [Planctomycetota bacterium]|nr:hypothetical protein [Planctomycetota bacterium]
MKKLVLAALATTAALAITAGIGLAHKGSFHSHVHSSAWDVPDNRSTIVVDHSAVASNISINMAPGIDKSIRYEVYVQPMGEDKHVLFEGYLSQPNQPRTVGVPVGANLKIHDDESAIDDDYGIAGCYWDN